MFLRRLHLRQFRNYTDQKVQFEAQKTILVGNNAQGKSNLLEAVELLATLNSHRTSRDRDLVQNEQTTGQITATVERKHSTIELGILLRKQGRRTLKLNTETLRRQMEFLGQVNAVQFSGLDLDLVRGGPEIRRNWLDALVIQLEPVYAYILQQYNQVLRQRNALLRRLKQEEMRSLSEGEKMQLALWDSQLAANGSRVTRRRARVLGRLVPIAQEWHRLISGAKEQLEIHYTPNVPWTQDNPEQVQQAFLSKIEQRRTAEKYQGRTVVGTHRDEIELVINNTPARAYGSQGQQRTLVLALKLAELKLIEEVIGEPPLLLLDDVLAELDPNRQNQLLEAIQGRFQTLITATHINAFDAQWLNASQIFSVAAGEVSNF
ncbi:DNA replication/repair protein RecF [Spirulina sp. CS-785/01]|uniref:DNA replication/repair protein RecF n=1 Tax=Spirulina sp. CS-785/01 TaxID=3021716 RepID=UPI00233132A4|nr:DNA replication/repair protein RecF [Spirulina sp. CS-785/01]MDB9313923.1 DNA replication/repair protein RecF [Spirulina sp. CS-785/01]